jgi:hypothetical protein
MKHQGVFLPFSPTFLVLVEVLTQTVADVDLRRLVQRGSEGDGTALTPPFHARHLFGILKTALLFFLVSKY